MARRVAALDLGTNTFHLLIADVHNNSFIKLIEEQRHAKLGEGGIADGRIAAPAFQRGLGALRYFKSVIDANQVTEIKACGTAALRTAKNGEDFINRVFADTGIRIEIIEGGREAALIYKGVSSIADLGASSLLMDIGGGSVEFIFCSAGEIFWKKSYPVGAAKLMALFHHSDPISDTDKLSVRNYLVSELMELKEKAAVFKPEKLIGSAGAFETFAALVNGKFKKDDSLLNQNNYDLDLEELEGVLEEIIKSNHEERAMNALILPVRVDMIVTASLLTKLVMEMLGIRKAGMCRFALKEGLLLD